MKLFYALPILAVLAIPAVGETVAPPLGTQAAVNYYGAQLAVIQAKIAANPTAGYNRARARRIDEHLDEALAACPSCSAPAGYGGGTPPAPVPGYGGGGGSAASGGDTRN